MAFLRDARVKTNRCSVSVRCSIYLILPEYKIVTEVGYVCMLRPHRKPARRAASMNKGACFDYL